MPPQVFAGWRYHGGMSADDVALRVECHAGYRGEETPRRFTSGGATVEIAEILDRWLAPDHRYFKVRGADGCVYILRHAVGPDRWELTMYASARRDEKNPAPRSGVDLDDVPF